MPWTNSTIPPEICFKPNGRGGMSRPPTRPVGLRVEAAVASAEINVDLICPLRQPSFPPGTHKYDPSRHNLIEGVSKCIISREEAQAKFNEYCGTLGPHDEVSRDGSKIDERVGAAAVINRHFQNGEITCHCLSKRLPDNSTIFAAEATAITLALDYHRHMEPVHDVVVYSDSMLCLQAIEGEDTENPLFCYIMNLLWLLNDKGTHVRFCWIPSHCGIEGNEKSWVPWPWHWPIGKSPLCRFKAINQLLYPAAGSDQMGCVRTWQRSPSLEANTRSTQEISAPNQSWWGCHHPASNWSYQGHEVPYLVPRTSHYLQSLCTDVDHWPHALEMCSSAGNSGWILHCWLFKDPLWEDSWDLHSGIFTRSRILLSDMNCQRS